MKYIQSFNGWKIYQTAYGFRARQGKYWSSPSSTLESLRQAIAQFESARRLQAARG